MLVVPEFIIALLLRQRKAASELEKVREDKVANLGPVHQLTLFSSRLDDISRVFLCHGVDLCSLVVGN